MSNINYGIQLVRKRLIPNGDGRPRLFFFDTMVHTIKETGVYRYPDPKEGRNPLEDPIDEANHAMDVVRYIVTELDHGVSGGALRVRL